MTTSSTVIVATAGRPQALSRCLAALAGDLPKGPREILVVDNAPSRNARGVAEAGGARWLPEPRPGKSQALNAGIAAANGEVLLFTDDDVTVRPGWTDALVAALSSPDVGLAGGRLLPRWSAPVPAWLAGPHAVHLTLRDYGPDTRPLRAPEFPYGAALGARAELLRALAPAFDPRLGPRPGLKLGHEEVHLTARVRALGLSVLHVGAAVADHVVDPARVDRGRLRRLVLQSGVGAARRERLLGVPPGPLPVRLAQTGVSLARAVRLAARRTATAESVDLETGAWAMLGARLERLAGPRSPQAVDWIATRLAGRGAT